MRCAQKGTSFIILKKMRTKLILSYFVIILNNQIYSQIFFNKIVRDIPNFSYRIHNLRVNNNIIHTAGIGKFIRTDDNTFDDTGVCSTYDLKSNKIISTYIDKYPYNSVFINDVFAISNDSIFTFAGFNYNYTISIVKIDLLTKVINKINYLPNDTLVRYGWPTSLIKTNNKYITSLGKGFNKLATPFLILTDFDGKNEKHIEIKEEHKYSEAKQVKETKNDNLVVLIGYTDLPASDINYQFISQIREIDTLGNTKWMYNSPQNRYININKFVPLANGNYLLWGNEEYSKVNSNITRSVTDIKPYLCEVSPTKGLVWERHYNPSAVPYSFKMLKDSSMLMAGRIGTFAFLMKLDKNRDSVFTRIFNAPDAFHGSNLVISLPKSN